MKKFIIATCIVVLLVVAGNIAYYQLGVYIDWNPNAKVTSFVCAKEKDIYLTREGVSAPFEIRGVDMALAFPENGRRTTPSTSRRICAGLRRCRSWAQTPSASIPFCRMIFTTRSMSITMGGKTRSI